MFPIPYDLSLVDVVVFFQYVDVDTGGPFFGLGRTSDAIAVRVGGPFTR